MTTDNVNTVFNIIKAASVKNNGTLKRWSKNDKIKFAPYIYTAYIDLEYSEIDIGYLCGGYTGTWAGSILKDYAQSHPEIVKELNKRRDKKIPNRFFNAVEEIINEPIPAQVDVKSDVDTSKSNASTCVKVYNKYHKLADEISTDDDTEIRKFCFKALARYTLGIIPSKCNIVIYAIENGYENPIRSIDIEGKLLSGFTG